jgi:molybdopterin molybdotransferase
MLSVQEAFDLVVAGFTPLSSETVSLEQAHGRVLSEDVSAKLFHPPADVSSMDGYAVRAEDVANVPTTLTQVGESAAGGRFDGHIKPGQTARIFTGAPVPDGADAIVIQENTEASGNQIKVLKGAPKGKFVRPKGMDFSNGDILLKAGQVMTARDIATAAAMNCPWLRVHRKPKIAVLATGNELVMPGEPVGPGQIISSNSVALASYVAACGGQTINLGIAKDTEESLLECLKGAKGADLLVTMGGASVGDYDLVGKVLDDQGMDLGFYKVAMRPGKPLIFGRLGDVPVLGLPGNPVSAAVSTIIFVRAAIRVMQGLPTSAISGETAILGEDLPENDERQDYLRSQFSKDSEGNPVVVSAKLQDSAMLARLAKSDCLVIRAPFAKPAKAGEQVKIITLGQGILTI